MNSIVARAEAIRVSEALEAEAAQKALLQQAHETEVEELEARLEAAAESTKSLQASLSDVETKAREAASVSDQVQQLRKQLEEQAESLQTKDVQLEEASAAVARMREELNEAHAITDAAGAEMSVLKGRVGQVTSALSAAATSLEALGSARTVEELFATLVRELANEFARVAIFRVKGNHLEGDLAVGLDDSVDIQKIIVPLGLSSVMTKAATDGVIQHTAREEIGESRPPFGGSPAFVVAAPLLFDGDVLAVVYGDSDTVLTEAHSAFAAVLVRHANAVLARFALEVKTARQLRDYARTLLQEVDAIFTADIGAGIPEPDRIQRLRANIGFARDLYAQRAALESPLETNLLEDEIGRTRRGADASSPFAYALATSLDDRDDLLKRAGVVR